MAPKRKASANPSTGNQKKGRLTLSVPHIEQVSIYNMKNYVLLILENETIEISPQKCIFLVFEMRFDS